MLIIILGTFLVIAGLTLLALAALGRRRSRAGTAHTLPSERARSRAAAFLGVDGNWPGIAMLVIGAALLLVPPAV